MDVPQKRFRDLLNLCVELQASDIHLTSGCLPYMRLRNEIKAVSDERFSPFAIEQLAMSMMTDSQRQVFDQTHTIDFAFFSDGGSRFRVNVYRQRGTVALCLRRLDEEFKSFDELTLPPQMSKLADYTHGLVLVTGPTGSGKSTTLATIVNQINETRAHHIITIEDPVEYIHPNKKGLVHQRELHCDVLTFADAVRAALREDPDVILVGEMRDRETTRAAIIAAETGHLVLSTLHTGDVVGSISRMISVFPAEEQDAVRNQLSRVLRAVVAQRLVHRVNGVGRAPAVEIMFVTSAIQNLIRTGDLTQIYSMMQTGNADGMLLLEQSLASLFAFGLIGREEATQLVRDKNIFETRLRRIQETRGAAPQPA